MKFSLVIPLWNEERNVNELVRAIAESSLPQTGMSELILVNNGSTDQTRTLVDEAARKFSWVTPLHLEVNQNYGGGVYEGCKISKEDVLCYIPGDLQVLPNDVVSVHQIFSSTSSPGEKLFVKGYRTVRFDPAQTQIVSKVFTFMANRILGLSIKDVNGLPKMFHRSLLDLVPSERMKTFVFDAQIISLARRDKWTITEIPVTFHSRRQGISSWSSKRIRVYITVFKQLFRLRALRSAPGVPLERTQ